MRQLFVLLVMLILGQFVFAQIPASFNHKVEQKETMYKLTYIYKVNQDSILKWNNLNTSSLSVGQSLTIINLSKLTPEDVVLNRLKYKKLNLQSQQIKNTDWLSASLDKIKEENKLLDDNVSADFKQILVNNKRKKALIDSIASVNENLTTDIQDLDRQIEVLTPKPIEVIEIPKEEIVNENIIDKADQQTVKIEEEPIEVELEEEKKSSKKQKNKKEEGLKTEKDIQSKEKGKVKENKVDQQNNQDKGKIEALETDLEETEKKKKEKAEKKIKSVKEGIEEPLVEALPKDTVKKKKTKNQNKPEKTVKESKPTNEKTEKPSKEKKQDQVDQTLDDKQKVAKKNNKNTDQLGFEIEDEMEVLVFDVGVQTPRDTTTLTKRQIKKNQKIADAIAASTDDSLEIFTNVTIDEVVVVENKKKKYKIGDEVDQTSKEKARFFLSRAKIEMDKDNFKKALSYLDKSLAINPSYGEAYILRGDFYVAYNYFEKAIGEYNKAILLKAGNAQMYYNIGNCLIRLGDKPEAIIAMSKAIELDENYIMAYAGRSSMHLEEKDFDAAIEDYNTILGINKYFYPAFKGRGVAYLNNGEYDKAIIDFNRLLEYEPEDGFVFYQRGMAKMYDNEIYGGCMDFLSADELGYPEAQKAISKYCD